MLFSITRHASACKRTPAGFLLPMKFTKPAIPLDDQIVLLRSRGLTIADEGAPGTTCAFSATTGWRAMRCRIR
jgi:hypothetical protein